MVRYMQKESAEKAFKALNGKKWIERNYLNRLLLVKSVTYEVFCKNIGEKSKLRQVEEKLRQEELANPIDKIYNLQISKLPQQNQALPNDPKRKKDDRDFFKNSKNEFGFLILEIIDYWLERNKKTRKLFKRGYVVVYMNYPNDP
jgi:hypothetical protein